MPNSFQQKRNAIKALEIMKVTLPRNINRYVTVFLRLKRPYMKKQDKNSMRVRIKKKKKMLNMTLMISLSPSSKNEGLAFQIRWLMNRL